MTLPVLHSASRIGHMVVLCAALTFGAAVFPGVGPGAALAFNAVEGLPDARQEARARALFKQLRCLVCQNQSIDDSEADLARDLRVLVRERIAAGATDDEILVFLTARYGDFVLLKPPVELRTWPLWYGPFALLVIAAAGICVLTLRRRRADAAEPAPLTDEERARLQLLLDGGGKDRA